MLTAKEAREIATAKQDELVELLDWIAEFAKRRETSVLIEKNLTAETINELEKLGFKVKGKQDYYYQMYYTISW